MIYVDVKEGECFRINVEILLKQRINEILEILKTRYLLYSNEIIEIKNKSEEHLNVLELQETLNLLEPLVIFEPNYIEDK